MAQPPHVSVIGSQYCDPCQLELTIVRQLLKVSDGNFVVTDTNGGTVFEVIGKVFTMHCRRVLVDGAGNPIATLLQKTLSVHDRWRVYKGESDKERDLLFSVKKSTILQRQPKLRIFLATNKEEDECDFKVEKSLSSWVIYAGESSTILAQMAQDKTNIITSFLYRKIWHGKDKFKLTINPSIDYAFMVALVVILDGIKEHGTTWLDLVKAGIRLGQVVPS